MLAEVNVANIYVRTNISLLQIIYLGWCRENCQHSMSSNTYLNHILMENYKRQRLTSFMLE